MRAPFMQRLPRFARLVLVALIAGVAVGTLATTSRLPVAPAGVAAANRSTIVPTPAPWYALRVASGSFNFRMPRSMPQGAPFIRARAGILVDMDTGAILWSKQPDLELAPASLTKVLTALVALENFR